MDDYQSGSSTELQGQSIVREFHYIALIDEILGQEIIPTPTPFLLGGLASSESQPPNPVVGLSGDHPEAS